jgi:hypothetical protein
MRREREIILRQKERWCERERDERERQKDHIYKYRERDERERARERDRRARAREEQSFGMNFWFIHRRGQSGCPIPKILMKYKVQGHSNQMSRTS